MGSFYDILDNILKPPLGLTFSDEVLEFGRSSHSFTLLGIKTKCFPFNKNNTLNSIVIN